MLTEFESQVLLWMQVPSSPRTQSARTSWMRIFHPDRLYVGTILTVKKFMAYLESYVLCVFLFCTISGNVLNGMKILFEEQRNWFRKKWIEFIVYLAKNDLKLQDSILYLSSETQGAWPKLSDMCCVSVTATDSSYYMMCELLYFLHCSCDHWVILGQ